MKECDCNNWRENNKILGSAIALYHSHGFGSLKKSFWFCPYCGKKLVEVKE